MPLYCNSNQAKFPQPDIQNELTVIELLASRGIYPVKTDPQHPKNYYQFLCPLPGHADDHNPSFYVHKDGIRWKCFVCGPGGRQGALIRLLGSEPIARTPKPPKAAKKASKEEAVIKGCTLAQLAAAKNLPIEFLRSLGWYDTIYKGKPAVAIPWHGGIHYRVNLDEKPKYLWERGSKVSILGIDQLEAIRHGGWVLLVEGETDFVAGRLMGLPVLAIPGAGTWRDEWSLQFQGCQIYVWKEQDNGGETFVEKLGQSFWDVQIIDAPAGIKDLCDLHDQSGEGAGGLFEELKSEARCWRQVDSTSTKTFHKPNDQNVTSRVKDIPINYLNSRGDKSALRRYAAELFPPPTGVKAWGKVHVLTNEARDTLLGAFLQSPSWRNPVNASDKLQAAFVNLSKRLSGYDIYELTIPADDWDDKRRRALGRRILRAGARAVHFDNLLALGFIRYLVDKPLKDAVPVDDLESTLISALRGIRPPSRGEDVGRFHPIDGTPEWVDGLYDDPEKDRGKWHVFAVAGPDTKDLVDLEIVAVSEGLTYEWVKSYWRLQRGPGILIYGMSLIDWLKLLEPLGYTPTKLGQAILAGAFKEEICS